MRVLITGAGGFLGSRVVNAFLAAGHEVRALVRPASRADAGWGDEVEIHRADLRGGEPLDAAFEDVDVLVHLAACVAGDDEERFVSTVVGTERLLDAMGRSQTKKIVLASTFSVYDWRRIRDVLDEQSPLEEEGLYARDGYAVAKLWQERVVRRASEEHGFDLRVLRPGFIWGPGRTDLAGVGQRVGPLHFIFGLPDRRIPLTHVDNCAEAFVRVASDERARGQTFNVVDDEGQPVWRWARDEERLRGVRSLRIPVPYTLAYGVTQLASLVSRLLFGPGGKLPSLLVPCRFEARFKPLRFSNEKLSQGLGWRPMLSHAEALRASGDGE